MTRAKLALLAGMLLMPAAAGSCMLNASAAQVTVGFVVGTVRTTTGAPIDKATVTATSSSGDYSALMRADASRSSASPQIPTSYVRL
ncbi:MAG TPA: hypothetical protein VMG98_14130 [Verrucomicrobiae bacterium]|nr:hypothetical protein [Verrucomicrobiae bacterium]